MRQVSMISANGFNVNRNLYRDCRTVCFL